jgi:FkbM family methyltransferase
MTAIERQFDAAVSRLARTPALKLLDPGVGKFATRWLARRRPQPSPLTARLFFGADMTVVLPEVISEAIYTYGMFDPTVTWMALKSVRAGDLIFDVGAHFGYFSLLFAHLTGANGRVIAFEPTPSTFAILQANARRSNRIEAVNQAAGDADGEVEIADFGLKYSAWNTLAAESRMPGLLGANACKHLKVPAVRLDAYARARGLIPDFIKIDAENFEHAVVNGLQGLLEQSQPVVLLEAGSESALAAGRRFEELGYRVVASDGPGSLHAWNGTLESANARYKDLLFVPRGRLTEFETAAPEQPLR